MIEFQDIRRWGIGVSLIKFSISKIRVRYADTDQMGIVYYGKYFEYFEEGRSDYFRMLGLPYSKVEEKNYGLPVVETKANYLSPAKFDDLLIVKTIVSETPASVLKFEYEISKEGDKKIITKGYTVHVFFDLKSKKSVRVPKFILELFK